LRKQNKKLHPKKVYLFFEELKTPSLVIAIFFQLVRAEISSTASAMPQARAHFKMEIPKNK